MTTTTTTTDEITDDSSLARNIIEAWVERLPGAARAAITPEAVADLVDEIEDVACGWADPGDEEPWDGAIAVVLHEPMGGGWLAWGADSDDREHAALRLRRPGVEIEIAVDLDRGETVGELPEGVSRARVDRLLSEIVPMLRAPEVH